MLQKTTQQLDDLAKRALKTEKNIATFCDRIKNTSTKRFSFYVSFVDQRHTEQYAQTRARLVAEEFSKLMTDAGIEFYSCIPHRCVGHKQVTWKVVAVLPLY